MPARCASAARHAIIFTMSEAIEITDQHDVKVMTFPDGRMDGSAIRKMYETTVELIDQPNMRLLVDLSGIDMVSSSAMGMFVTMKKKCLGVGAQLNIFVPSESVMGAFNLMRLNRVLNLHSSRDDALRAFKPPAI